MKLTAILYTVLLVYCFCFKMDAKLDPTNTENPMRSHLVISKNKKLLKIVEKKFMDFMGLTGKPDKKFKEKIKVPEHLWKLYYKWSDENYEDYDKNNADTARVIYHDLEKDHVMRKPLSNLRFNISGMNSKEKIERAELLLYNERKNKKLPKKKTKIIKVYHPKNDKELNKNLVAVKKVESNKLGYTTFDVTKVVKSWMNNSVDDTSIVVDVGQDKQDHDDVHLRKRRGVSDKDWQRKRPLLILYTKTGDAKRKKPKTRVVREKRGLYDFEYGKRIKRLNETHQRVRRETCRLRAFYLDFGDVGWDKWILAPTGYGINYCSGECPKPLGPHFNTTNHAVIQNSVLSLNRRLVPPLCCIPTTLKDQTFLYLDNNGKLALKNPIQMIALGCGCR